MDGLSSRCQFGSGRHQQRHRRQWHHQGQQAEQRQQRQGRRRQCLRRAAQQNGSRTAPRIGAAEEAMRTADCPQFLSARAVCRRPQHQHPAMRLTASICAAAEPAPRPPADLLHHDAACRLMVQQATAAPCRIRTRTAAPVHGHKVDSGRTHAATPRTFRGGRGERGARCCQC